MQTITYSRIGSLEIKLDLYTPDNALNKPLPAVVWFHGGAIVTSGRNDVVFSDWLKRDSLQLPLPFPHPFHATNPITDGTISQNYLFISADHRFILPSTGFDIISDVQALFKFITSPNFKSHLPDGVSLDPHRIAVAGTSGGGYPASAAALFAVPKPKAVLMEYAMAGQFLDHHWLFPKGDGEQLTPMPIDEEAVARARESTQPVCESPLSRTAEGGLSDETGRVMLFPWLWKTGEFVDYIVGDHGLADKLRKLPLEEREGAVPEEFRKAILQTQYTSEYPPTVLLHGKEDPLVLIEESKHTYAKLKALGVKVELHALDGAVHGLRDKAKYPESAPGAEEVRAEGMKFLVQELGKA